MSSTAASFYRVVRAIYRAGRTVYYSVFNRFATATLRRPDAKYASIRLNEPSIKIVSFFGWKNGISEGALLQRDAFKALGYAVETVDVTRAMGNTFAHIESQSADLFIVHCGPDQFLRSAFPLRHFFSKARVAFYLAWELATPPRDWGQSPDLWDEIWSPSRHSARALSQWCSSPVRIVPHVVLRECTGPREWRRTEEPFRFLTMADARSSLSRKNPQGTVRAFRLAFPYQDDVELIVKLHKTEVRDSRELDELLSEAKLDPRIRLVNQDMTRRELDQLFLDAHAFVSLHRAEGFGIPLLEAQTFGLATIATSWSGNLDFTTAETTLLIPYNMTTTYDPGGVYGKVTWADPDISAAAAAMRTLYSDPSEFRRVAYAGWKSSRPQVQLNRFASSLRHTTLCNGD